MNFAKIATAILCLSVAAPLCGQEGQSPSGEQRTRPAPARTREGDHATRIEGTARQHNTTEQGKEPRREIDPATVEQIAKLVDANHDGKLDPAECARFHAAVEKVMQRARQQQAAEREERRDDRKDGRQAGREERRDARSPNR